MEYLTPVSRIIIALGLLNVWLLRTGKPTAWRGRDAQNMREEFAAYGLPAWSMGVVGFLKVALAILLLAGIWFPAVTRPAAIGVAVLMAGAVAMHVKVSDPLKKSLPALALLGLAFVVIFLP
jgi:uncharacterized membrane protein YphA (DoxX/SURF4 family)